MPNDTCRTCKFWRDDGDYVTLAPGSIGTSMGWCRRSPPVLSAAQVRRDPGLDEGDDHFDNPAGDLVIARDHTAWPVTLATEWCGRFEERADVSHDRIAEDLRASELVELEDGYATALAPPPGWGEPADNAW